MNRNILIGPILILLGAFLFIRGDLHFSTGSIFVYFWPSLFILPVSIFFHWLYFGVLGRRGVGVLVPGGVLLAVAIVCQIAMLFDSWGIMWPGFIFAPAAGLFELYWFGGRNKWLLIPINILTGLSLLFFAIFSIGAVFGSLAGSQPVIASILIIAGAFLILTRRKSSI
ncbi:hypothetical protein DCC85_21435 [Paenibacillus sp. CAA11]|uniref:hypothetical protein n=1 Tax=Paenibacillus sp. CAA11 TaxID=1532905 RepID=UPI000D38F809|nr:hypothetical protein [Paenibacillus sp. CAA11]AWB47089.1 hypothetical protein DCC85_21435 [Paenibacillus sp. CAA11]